MHAFFKAAAELVDRCSYFDVFREQSCCMCVSIVRYNEYEQRSSIDHIHRESELLCFNSGHPWVTEEMVHI